jgi:hypothetical protein
MYINTKDLSPNVEVSNLASAGEFVDSIADLKAVFGEFYTISRQKLR